MNKLIKKSMTLFAVVSMGAVMMGAAPASSVNKEVIPAVQLVEAVQ